MSVSDYNEYVKQKQVREVAIPVDDNGVMKLLRKLGQPICLFGEDEIDRRKRCKEAVHNMMAIPIAEYKEDVEYIPKFVVGSDDIISMKTALISFSLSKSKERIRSEKRITQERIDANNLIGKKYLNYQTIASEQIDTRPLTYLSNLNNFFATGGLSGKVFLCDSNELSIKAQFPVKLDRVTGVAMINESAVAISSLDPSVKIWFPEASEDEQSVVEIPVQSPVSYLCSHPAEKYLIAGLSDGSISVVDIEYQKMVVAMKSNDGMVSSVAAHSDGGIIYGGGADFIGRFFDLRSCRAIKTLIGHTGRITASKFDESHLYTGAFDNTVYAWDMRNLQRSVKIAAHTAPVTSLDVYNDLLLTSSIDKTAKVWSKLDFRQYAQIEGCPSPIVGCSFINDGNDILLASRDGHCRLCGAPFDF